MAADGCVWPGSIIKPRRQVRRHRERAPAATDAAVDGTDQSHQPTDHHSDRRLHAHCVQPAGAACYITHSPHHFAPLARTHANKTAHIK